MLFAALGLVPLSLGVLVRLRSVQAWAARETSRLLEQKLGLHASYTLHLEPWPLQLALRDLRVEANDGGTPFLAARRVVVQPRIFALLDGVLDVGEVRIEEPMVRAVVVGGKLTNLDLTLPAAAPAEPPSQLPLSALSLSNGELDLALDGARLRVRHADIDLAVDENGDARPGSLPPRPVELSVRSSAVAFDHLHAEPTGGERLDEDRLCSLELRARLAAGELLVRRLDVDGALDLDPSANSRPSCNLPETDWRRTALHAAALRVAFDDEGLTHVEGRVSAKLPLPIVHRVANVGAVSGALSIDADDLAWNRGDRLPKLAGRLVADDVGVSSKSVAERLRAEIGIENDVIRVTGIEVGWSGGDATIDEVRLSPLAEGVPLEATAIRVKNVAFARLFESLNGSPNAHVAWQLDDVAFATFKGTLSPLALRGPMLAETRDFTVFDRPAWREDRRRLVGLTSARIEGEFEVAEAGVFLNDLAITMPRSKILTTVKLHFTQDLGVSIREGTLIDLADLTPLASLNVAGRVALKAETGGRFTHPELRGEASIDDLVVEGFPVGKLAGNVAFEPVRVDLTNGTLWHGKSTARLPALALDFGRPPATLVLTSSIDTTASGFHAEDFLEMLRLERDPRFRDIRALARGTADARFVLGGPEDACGGGRLSTSSRFELADVTVLGQGFDTGGVELDYLWDDRAAGALGVVVDVHALTLRRGEGTVVGRASIRHDGEVEADFTATAMPLASVDLLGLDQSQRRILPEGTVAGVARFDGTLQRLRGVFDVSLSPVRLGPAMLPSSRLEIVMLPESKPVEYEGKTVCENRIVKGANQTLDGEEERGTEEAASYQIRRGKLFGGQVSIDDLILTRGERQVLREGTLRFVELDLGALANLVDGVAYSSNAPTGSASGEVRLEQMPLDNPVLGEARVRIDKLEVARDGLSVRIGKVDQEIALTADSLKLPSVPLTVSPRGGLTATVTVSGRIEELSTLPRLDLHAQLTPVDLARLTERLPFVSRAAGLVSGGLHVDGPYLLPSLTGELRLERGLVRFAGPGLPLDDVNVRLLVKDGEIEIKEASARAGASGQLSLTGRMPIRGLALAEINATLAARDIALPLADGVKATANALLKVTYQPGLRSSLLGDSQAASEMARLPQVSGTVSLSSFTYARPIAFRLDLDQLTGKARTVVDAYDPRNDLVAFDVSVVSPRPLRISNNLLETSLEVSAPGLRLTGTNQRFGARGSLRLETGSKLFIQGHDFRVREGRIDFDNPTRVTPKLDVSAETEIRRYASTATSSSAQGASAADASASAGNVWRVRMHATGDTDAPALQLSSDPPLSQDDIVLLLQLGMTRAELDRSLATSLAQSVSFEALSALTGFDQALRKTVPLIDDFRLGSQYSSRTGRPEPTVSVGKRITEDVRATVTSGLSDNRELRSNIEWKLRRGVSLQGSYDNVNDVSSSAIGNLGADLRWRIEFE
ncbi:MAG: translocation/assembly module TamB domain-containing protein [Deltaproteobacteria bacterium]|nr:translocation/assembly module TamB domain-containing protein [Deltaproteobacteria bacterium]